MSSSPSPSISHNHQIPILRSLVLSPKTITDNLSFGQFGPTAIITSRLVSTNIKSFVNRKMGLSTDIRPLSFILKDLLFHESDTGSLYLSDGTITSLAYGATKPETLQNKLINVETTDLGNGIITDNSKISPFAINYRKQGGIIPAATINDSFYGIIGDVTGLTLYNANKIVNVENEGLELEFHSVTNGQKMGYITTVPIARRSANYEMKGEFRSDTSKQFIGFSTASTLDETLVLRNVDKGFIMGYLDTDTNFYLYHNDGNGARVKDDFGIAKDSNLHTYEIKMSPSNIIITIDGGSHMLTVTTTLPDIDDDLYFFSYGVY